MGPSDKSSPIMPDGGNCFRTEYHNEPPVQAIARALSAIENSTTEDAPRFYRYADPDAMNRLMETARDSDQDISVQVKVDDYRVSVESDGTISICRSELESDSENSE